MWVFFLQDKPNINALSSNIKCTVLTTTSLVSYNMYKTLQHVLSPEKGNMTITPVLISLHWLPVHYRCQYKLLIYVYKAQHGKAPSYLQELITPYKPNRALRSGNSMLLHPPNDVRTKSYGERRFDKAAPTLWNSLPLSLWNVNSLDVFKRELKTHFFRIDFKNFL
jgi:hypothetical protein